jgi:hypothetical protein
MQSMMTTGDHKIMLTKKHMVMGNSYLEEYGRYPKTEILLVPLVVACAQQAVHCDGLAARYNDTSLVRNNYSGGIVLSSSRLKPPL